MKNIDKLPQADPNNIEDRRGDNLNKHNPRRTLLDQLEEGEAFKRIADSDMAKDAGVNDIESGQCPTDKS